MPSASRRSWKLPSQLHLGSAWLDLLCNGAIASISSHTTLYVSLFTVTLTLLLLPSIAVCWHSVRFEQRRALLFFIGLGLLFEVVWVLTYDSLVWRWTWMQWPFFVSLAVAAHMKSGKGLKEYLQAANAGDRKTPASVDGGWEADIGRRISADRLSQTLDFDAH